MDDRIKFEDERGIIMSIPVEIISEVRLISDDHSQLRVVVRLTSSGRQYVPKVKDSLDALGMAKVFWTAIGVL